MINLLLSLILLGRQETVRVNPTSPGVQLKGRFSPSPLNNSWVNFDQPGSEVVLIVANATALDVVLMQQHPPQTKYSGPQSNYFVVLIDGIVQPGWGNATFSTATVSNTTGTSIRVASGLDPTTPHTIRLFKSSEAQW
jgi:hypothetical protein